MTVLRAFAFGELDAGVWGAAWLPGPGDEGQVAVGAPSDSAVLAERLHGAGALEDWRLGGDGGATELTFYSHGEPVAVDPDDDDAGFDQLCRVNGRLQLAGELHELSCLGWRALRRDRSELERLGSVRAVAAWFEPGEGLAVVAVRPRKARGQESDVISAAVLDGESACAVADPRLSTTYTEAGVPIRAGIELWVGEEETEQRARRAAGQARGAAVGWTVSGLRMHAQLFGWSSRGRDGAGVYLLGQSSSG